MSPVEGIEARKQPFAIVSMSRVRTVKMVEWFYFEFYLKTHFHKSRPPPPSSQTLLRCGVNEECCHLGQ